MDPQEKDIEILISRHLDGELGEDEELELNRRLIRSPEARRLLEECQSVDALADAALEQAVPRKDASYDLNELTGRGGERHVRRYHRGWWLVPGAIAAALLAVAVNQVTLPGDYGPRVAEKGRVQVAPGQTVPLQVEDHGGVMRNAGMNATPRRQIKRDIARDVYGIMGDDGRIYWIEVDRVRTIKRPNAESNYRPVSEEL
jgi:hypothetical protein